MAWSGGTFTRANGSTEWQDDAALGIGIEAAIHDAQDNDLATGINNCLTKDGQNTPTANLPMGGYKHTGVANATGSGQYTTYNQLQDNTFQAFLKYASVNETGGARPVLQATSWSNDTQRATIYLNKSRGTTVGDYTIVNNGDTYGDIIWRGCNGTDFDIAGRIRVVCTNTPGATNDMPGTMLFDTTANGSSTVTERMRIDSEGKVGIAMTPVSAQLAITAELNTSAAVQTWSVTGDVAQAAIEILKFDNNSTTTQNFIHFWINNGVAQSGKITANGANQATFTSTSDERLKENIVDLPPQLNNILNLRPVEFDYKDGSGHQTGFIAQEVQQVYPDLVSQNDNGFLDLAGLGKFEARLIKAIQELEARVAALEAP